QGAGDHDGCVPGPAAGGRGGDRLAGGAAGPGRSRSGGAAGSGPTRPGGGAGRAQPGRPRPPGPGPGPARGGARGRRRRRGGEAGGKWGEAREEAQRAKALTDDGPVEPGLAERVAALRSELDDEQAVRRLVAGLEQIRLLQAELNVKQGRFAVEEALPQYRKA